MNVFEKIGTDRSENYILPFLWMGGETHGEILHELHKIYECGIREVCLESRTHPDFAGPLWWEDLDVLMSEAKRLGMRIWILDDDHFPTGHANGRFAGRDRELRKTYLGEKHADFMAGGSQAFYFRGQLEADARILSILAVKRKDGDTTELSMEEWVDLTDCIEGDFAFFQLPGRGIYRVFVFYTTQLQGGRENYMNLIDADSVQVLINEVYEKHYERYREEFGKTFAGFFSDEPQLGNVCGYDFGESLGREGHKVPWSRELEQRLRERWADGFARKLPLLWYEGGKETPAARIAYMDEMTKLVYECFSGKLGMWCRERGVEYIGHIIEDNHADLHMGCGIGHYFREMKGQAMAGIDVVHYQIVPGHTGKKHQWAAWDGDGEFFHFVLGKLAASSARYDREKKGRALCEIFGNYGWGLEISQMKWLTDHMLVNGINHFVPHAFSVTDPNPDCPPHFYAGGNNPQFPLFKELMKYMNRLCALFSHGKAASDIAVLYNAESVWSGRECSSISTACRVLTENQILFDLLPEDFADTAQFSEEKGLLDVSGNTYVALIIPGCRILSAKTAAFLQGEAYRKEFPVYFAGEAPVWDSEGQEMDLLQYPHIHVCEAEALGAILERHCRVSFSSGHKFPGLRMYCYEKEEEKIFFFFNESVYDTVCTELDIHEKTAEMVLQYDGLSGRTFPRRLRDGKLSLVLEPGQTAVFATWKDGDVSVSCPEDIREEELDCEFEVTAVPFQGAEETEKMYIPPADKGPWDMSRLQDFGAFAGEFIYRGSFCVNTDQNKEVYLKFPVCYNGAQVAVNGIPVGAVLSSGDRLPVGQYMKIGRNFLEIRIPNTLIWKRQDPMSFFAQIHPAGLESRPVLEYQG